MRPIAALLAAALLSGLAAPAPAQTLTESDLAALRYFLSIDDQAAVDAERRRLELEFPGADVDAAMALIEGRASEVDTSPVWRAIEAADYAGARARIAELRAANPNWAPPADLTTILDQNEGQAKFEAAFAARDLAGAIAALAAHPSILTCDRINNPWRLAELQIAADSKADALATYDGVLQTCGQEDQVVATLYKANEIAERERLAAMFAATKARYAALGPRLAALETELGLGAKPVETAAAAPAPRASGGSGGSGGEGGGGGSRAKAAADRGDWATCLELTRGARAIADVNQRAWCAYNFGRPREAIADFRRVAENAGGTTARDATYGMALAYAAIGQEEQAAQVAGQAQLTRQQRAVVNKTIVSKLAVQAFEAGRYRTALQYLDRLSRDTGSLDRGLAMLRGWALLKSGNKSAAREQFNRVHQAQPGKDSLSGIIESR